MPKGKKQRAHRHVDPIEATLRNLKREIKKAKKKIEKLLRLREEKKPRKKVNKDTQMPRYQGIRKNSERHEKLLAHVENLKNRLKQINGN